MSEDRVKKLVRRGVPVHVARVPNQSYLWLSSPGVEGWYERVWLDQVLGLWTRTPQDQASLTLEEVLDQFAASVAARVAELKERHLYLEAVESAWEGLS